MNIHINPQESAIFNYKTLTWRFQNFFVNVDCFCTSIEKNLPYQSKEDWINRMHRYIDDKVVHNNEILLANLVHRAKNEIEELIISNGNGLEIFCKRIQADYNKMYKDSINYEAKYKLNIEDDIDEKGALYRQAKEYFQDFYNWLIEGTIIKKEEQLLSQNTLDENQRELHENNNAITANIDDLIKIILKNRSEDFLSIEIKLKAHNFLDKNNNWIGQKQQLVALICVLKEQKYLKDRTNGQVNKPKDYRHFFETRYKTNIREMSKTGKIKESKMNILKKEYSQIVQ